MKRFLGLVLILFCAGCPLEQETGISVFVVKNMANEAHTVTFTVAGSDAGQDSVEIEADEDKEIVRASGKRGGPTPEAFFESFVIDDCGENESLDGGASSPVTNLVEDDFGDRWEKIKSEEINATYTFTIDRDLITIFCGP